MSEFTYACPHCGQHIRCEAAQGGTTMECPTCFQKIMAPQCPTNRTTRFILTGIKIPKRPRPIGAAGAEAVTPPPPPAKKIPLAAIVAAGLVVLVAGAAVVFREKIFPRASAPVVPQKSELPPPATTAAPPVVAPVAAPPTNDPNWKLDLDGIVMPDTLAVGRLNGKDFSCQRVTLMGGSMALRQGNQWPPELGAIINLRVAQSTNLAGRKVHIAADLASQPKVTLRWRDGQQPALRDFTNGYAMRIEFGKVAGDRLPGKIYLCLPDEQKSYVAGSFSAEIIKPKAPVKAPAKTPKRKP